MPVSRPHPATHLLTLKDIIESAEAYNHPLTSTGHTGGSSSQPGSRTPGRANADRLMHTLDDILREAVTKARRATDAAHVHESRHTEPEAIGGIETDLVDEQYLTPHRRRVRVEVTQQRLIAKVRRITE